ncbi:short-chain dehydrogenase [Phenylobacterium sp. Root77]|jgi:NAD(P)-dependent dehydrogenase (short-subunit alcohol dehydrogenase family)|uniref:SDR family NAD(P)-dependent oxidoreductase n=1 Tax=unclassified Phenylobacterium TaxID=2640670 RepID=UPI0006F3F7D1|nr:MULTISPECIES: SDR family NAD(P)-dependent oxidoreductase [unclassified Phenylobacterium]KQW70966.1 short-chain dehydrogenase [Phenylobacterium sp. Root1277]KQW95876.1 short-chain dehydrogenase [Phenylobacterium sp. Root1290]KRC41661.1 short-chain dehydrogenase [Phenylobacterium sp. Root77]
MHPAIATGNVAVVTGAANGIGAAAARRFVREGLRVCLADADAEGLARVQAELGDQAVAVNVDVSDQAAMEALARTVADRLGPVSVLMNNAGVGGGGDALSNPEGWSRVLGINLMGVLHGVQAFAPAMAQSGAPGLVINTGSKQGVTMPPGDTAYNVSKAGVKALTEGLAHTLRNTPGCQVSAHLLVPGFTYTGMIARRIPERPAAAWTSEQVVDRMFEGIARGEFYLWCEDNETPRAVDEKRVLWTAGDIVENRPALSRWHPDWKERFDRYMAGE